MRNKTKAKKQKYLNESVILLAIFFLAIPFVVTFSIPIYIKYLWYSLPFIAFGVSILAHRYDKKTGIHPLLFSILAILTVLVFVLFFSSLM